MSEHETAQARQAALMLHGLPAAAGRQVLARLTPAEQRRLQPLLDELSAMGVPAASASSPADPSAGAEGIEHRAAESSAAPGLSAKERAAALDADVIERCLRPCAAITAARLLQADVWPWRDRVLDLMPQPRRAAVCDAMRGHSVALAPAVLATWCECLCEQAQDLQQHDLRARRRPGQSARQSRSRIGALWDRLVAWTR